MSVSLNREEQGFAAVLSHAAAVLVRTSASLEPTLSAEPANIAKMPFEASLAELEGIVDQLEKGNVTLEASIKLYERGEALKARCEALLKDAEMRIEKIALGADGKPKGVVPLDPA
jgi:exodeoxyribonuclease VII small subunit